MGGSRSKNVAVAWLVFNSYSPDNDKETDSNESNTGVSEQSEECSSWRKKRKGQRSKWEKRCVNNLDAICSSVYYNKKLIFTSTKNLKNAEIHADVLKEFDQKYEDGSFPFSIDQLKNKFKICISECKKLLWLLRPRRAEKGFKMKSSLENGLINYFHWSKLGIHVTLTWHQSLLYRCSYLMGSKWKEHQITEPSIADHQQRNCHICFISSTFSLKACSFLGNGLHYHNHCKIQV